MDTKDNFLKINGSGSWVSFVPLCSLLEAAGEGRSKRGRSCLGYMILYPHCLLSECCIFELNTEEKDTGLRILVPIIQMLQLVLHVVQYCA